eukprot:TRINITY_DN2990_c0_g1_i2.p2 TRINITY_DN2990_c0_g1~~TRINITY_DN2990_c0_g1_i2.p2  ORF type:complete len:102 (+),score=0.04 TRINITY_DN2990_c0_g1_i2:181-486(+)
MFEDEFLHQKKIVFRFFFSEGSRTYPAIANRPPVGDHLAVRFSKFVLIIIGVSSFSYFISWTRPFLNAIQSVGKRSWQFAIIYPVSPPSNHCKDTSGDISV